MDRLLLLFLVCCVSTTSADQSKDEALAADQALWASITSSQVVVPKPVPKEWHIIEDPDFHLSLGFPCVPEREVSHHDGDDLVIYKCVDSKGISYVALYGSRGFTDGFNPDEFHAATAVGFMSSAKRAGFNMSAIPKMKMSYLDLNGRQIKFESERLESEVRTLVRRNFSCQLHVSGPPGQMGKTASMFFDSFNISHQNAMEVNQSDVAVPVFTWALVFANCIVYLLFKGGATVTNRIIGRAALHERWTGAIGVMIFTTIMMWYAREHFVNEDRLSKLPPFEQSQYIGYVLGIAIVPAILVLGTVAFRGWRQSHKAHIQRNTTGT